MDGRERAREKEKEKYFAYYHNCSTHIKATHAHKDMYSIHVYTFT